MPRGAEREIRFSGEPGLAVQGDAALLVRVVDNLVGNALKFAPGEPVDVAVGPAGGESVCLTVRDRGPGIPPGEREEIFRRFARGGSAATVPGLGLGLALVAEIVRWHGGRIDVEAPGSGGASSASRFPRRAGA
ncbi:MAG: HAMP domain-containing histidine kinase [Holophagales bacterium]|nr:HAMP domain-containing histidine kinase [Holophagales bacterium]